MVMRAIFVMFRDAGEYWVAKLQLGHAAVTVAGPFASGLVGAHVTETRAWQEGDYAECADAWPAEYEQERGKFERDLGMPELSHVCWIAKLAEGKLL